MNKSAIFSFLVAAVAATACGNASKHTHAASPAEPGKIRNFDIAMTVKSASASYLCVADTTFGADVPVFSTSSVSVQWPERLGDAVPSCLHDSLLSTLFASKPASVDAAIADFVAHPIVNGDYKLQPVDSVPSGNVRELFQNINCHTLQLSDDYIVFTVECSEYSGGAHPSYSASFLNYDVRNKNVLDFNEIFLPGNDDAILSQVVKALCGRFHAASLQELQEQAGFFIDSLFLTHNVYLTRENVVFFFNPYEIAPWAEGPVEVPVPWYEVDQFITANVRALIYK